MTPGDAVPGAVRRHRHQPDPPVRGRFTRQLSSRKPNAVRGSSAVTGVKMNPLFAAQCQIHQLIACGVSPCPCSSYKLQATLANIVLASMPFFATFISSLAKS